jgi:UDP-glucuronate decarboxylase
MTIHGQDTAAGVVQGDLDAICDGLGPDLEKLSGARLLIIGGAGFLGHYLVQAAVHASSRLAAPIDLHVYDNYIRGVPSWLKALEGSSNVTLRRHDVIDPLPVDAGAFDYIIHAASIASPTYYRRYPIETMDANVTGLRNLLDYATSPSGSGIRSILYFSTSEIYGDPDAASIPTKETYRGLVSSTGPRACYDESKRYGETLCVNFARERGVPVTMARPFNNYGPGLKLTDRRVLPDLVRDVLAGRNITLLSDGKPTRTFCYVADAVTGYYKILLRGRPGEPYNIGIETPEISMRELADTVASAARPIFGYEGEVVIAASTDADYLTDNPNRRCPDITKAREELDFAPQVSLEEGIRRSLVWYRENFDGEDS